MHFTTRIFPGGQVVAIPGAVDNLPGSSGPTVKGEEGTIEQAGSKAKDAADVAKGGMIGATGGVIGVSAGGMIYTLLSRGNDIPEGASLEIVIQRPLQLHTSSADGITDTHGEPADPPAAEQPRPLEKPAPMVCPPGGLGCQ